MALRSRGTLLLPPLRRGFGTSPVSKKELDLVSNAYLKQIREVTGRKDLLESSPEIKRQLEEQLNRLAAKFHLPSAEAVTKLDTKFEQATVLSSVDEVTEGRPVDQLMKELADSRSKYEAAQREKKRQEAERLAEVPEGGEWAKDFFPIPPPHIEAQQERQRLAAAGLKPAAT